MSSTKNWNCLPDEMKGECIKQMDIKNRINFRLVSKNDKNIVDSQKLETGDHATIFYFEEEKHMFITFKPLPGNYFVLNKRLENDEIPGCLEYLMRHATFKQLYINMHINMAQKFQSRVHAESFRLDCGTPEQLYQWLNKLEGNVKLLELKHCDHYPFESCDHLPFDEFIENERCANVHVMKAGPLFAADSAQRLAQIWINKNAEIGRKFIARIAVEGLLKTVSDVFADRLVDQRNDKVTIKIDESKYIIVREVELMQTNQKMVYMVVALAETTKDPRADQILFAYNFKLFDDHCVPQCKQCDRTLLENLEKNVYPSF